MVGLLLHHSAASASIGNRPVNCSRVRLLLHCVIALLAVLPCSHTSIAGDVDFNRDIRPILTNHCFQCHGPDDDSRQADLRLDQRAAAIAMLDDHAAIVPGDAAKSGLIERVMADDVDMLMPPPEFGKPLTASQRNLLKQWINDGAEYAKHWSFQPIQSPEIPEITTSGESRNPIDQFIIARLERAGLKPSPAADRYTLIRRVYLDLLGLPPSIEEVDAFVNAENDDAYEQLLDRVLANPHFGERWGRHWLDQARYADSHGYTVDGDRTMWPYRDWVINAFNRDLPFDQFTVEQLAGDLLPNADLSQKVATGFHRNTLVNQEGGSKPDQFRDEQTKDRTDTTGLVWMGLTVGCAKCHTHKFDPITQHEYYQLFAFFNSTADQNSVAPTVPVPTAEQSAKIERLQAQQADLNKQLADNSATAERRAAWEQSLLARAAAIKSMGKPEWDVLSLNGQSNKGTELIAQDDHSLLAKGHPGAPGEFYATATSLLKTVRSVRLEVLTHESLPKNGPGRASNGNFVLSEFSLQTADGKNVPFAKVTAEHSQPGHDVTRTIDGDVSTGWAINGAPEGSMNRNRTAWFALAQPISIEADEPLKFTLTFNNSNYAIGRFRISVSPAEAMVDGELERLSAIAKIPTADRKNAQQSVLTQAFIQQDAELAPLQASLTKVTNELAAVKKSIPTTMVMQELPEPRPTYLQVRGDFLRTSDEVTPAVPAVLPQLDGVKSGTARLEFARWLTSPEHPLTARVRVNRIWMRLFGRGLVETENDFGIQGSLPSHPELLDWLADQFRRNNWSQKQLIRLIMNSATYRQSSAARPDLETADALNLLLARQSRIRVEAEIVRDIALAVSGQLTERIGGPSVYPPQEEGVYAFTQTKKSWRTNKDSNRYRRGMYTYFYRSAPYPMLSTFDVPKFNATCTARDRSNTPLQSLTIANSTAMFELAQAFARRIIATDDDTDAARLQYAFRTSFARPPQPDELMMLTQYLEQSRQRFTDEEQTWTAVARLLMNLDEFITRE
ncbi:Planctomycete cytochrome C [Fuerstiella marisgermanici]|uniref:Planctomycete cytochrome C n=1 Tax=Fuerstiella marisgermanici TaxID=1891926 RepID=A0A1P8WNT7_9PLAN|nr:Planctomycete cytochrome C [Fuerstiella marisgermanici]